MLFFNTISKILIISSFLLQISVARFTVVSQTLSSLSLPATIPAFYSQTYTVNFPYTFSNIPEAAIALTTIVTNSTNPVDCYFSITQLTNNNVIFTVLLNYNAAIQQLAINIFLQDSIDIETQTINITKTASSGTIQFLNNHGDYFLYIFLNSFPAKINNRTKYINYTLLDLTSSSSLISGSFILVEEVFLANNFFIQFTNLQTNLVLLKDLLVELSNFTSDNSMIGLGFSTATGLINFKTSIQCNFNLGLTFYTYVSLWSINSTESFGSGHSSSLQIYGIVVNTNFYCPQGQYFSYNYNPPTSIPISCTPCDYTCLTCLYNTNNKSTSTSSDCLTCPSGRQLISSNSTSTNFLYRRGFCQCIYGFVENSNGICVCISNCLKFKIQAMVTRNTTSISEFLICVVLTFSQKNIVMLSDFLSNSKILFNNVQSSKSNIQMQQLSDNVYQFTIDYIDPAIQSCGSPCLLTFQVVSKSDIKTVQGKTLINNQYSQKLFSLDFSRPSNFQSFYGYMDTAVNFVYLMNGGRFVKILFELQQIMCYHMYLNITIPPNFLQILESLTNFRYLNILGVFNQDIFIVMINDSVNHELDDLGNIKLVQYDSGLNYILNMADAIGSFIVSMLIMTIVYLILRFLPIEYSKKLAEVQYNRKLNTFNDNMDIITMPTIFYGVNLLTYVTWSSQMLICYILMLFLSAIIFIYPILIACYVYTRRQDQKMKPYFEDLLMDCDIDENFTYILFVASFYRKIIICIFFGPLIPGMFQLFMALFINIVFFLMLLYTLHRKYYGSKSKIFLKLIFNASIITIQIIMLFFPPTSISGEYCNIASLISTLPILGQSIIKILEMIIQVLKRKQQEVEQKRKPKKDEDQSNRNDSKIHPDFRARVNVQNLIDNSFPRHILKIIQSESTGRIQMQHSTNEIRHQ